MDIAGCTKKIMEQKMLADSGTMFNMILISLFVLQVKACRLDVIFILLDSYAN